MQLADLNVFVEPQQGASYDAQLAVARHAEQLGFGGFFRSDHFLKMGDVSGLPGPTDSWVTLGALARETSTIRLGTLVTSATFRQPGVLAVTVAQVDQMSGGRVELGLGAGWYAAEHTAYGIGFPDLGERFDRFEEQLEVITGLWITPPGETFSHDGTYYPIADSPALPKPAQAGGPPIIIGGGGPKRTPALAARFAREYNSGFQSVEDGSRQYARVAAACEVIGRDPATLRRSVALVLACGATEEEFARRAAAIGRSTEDLRAHGVAGTVEQVVDTLGRWREAGAERIYLQMLDLTDLEHLDLVAAEVAPGLG